MRLLIVITLITFCHGNGIAQNKQTKEETVKWLQGKLGQNYSASDKKGSLRNYTKMCVNVNLLPDAATASEAAIAKNFKDKIVSDVSWKQEEMGIQNDIFINGKLRETYTYRVPLAAIVSATVTNCKRNVSGNVNAYVDRPVFIAVKKNTTRIGHVSFDKNGKAISSNTPQYHMNNKDADWDSIIPVAGNWNSNADLQDKVLKAFARLVELNGKKYAVN